MRTTVISDTLSGVFMSFCAWNQGTSDFVRPKNPRPSDYTASALATRVVASSSNAPPW